MKRVAAVSLATAVIALIFLGSCSDAPLTANSGILRVTVQFDPARGTPGSFNLIEYSFGASRTGDAAGAPAAANSSGSTSASDTVSQNRSAQNSTFAFPDAGGLMQGVWEISLTVRGDGGTIISSTCTGQVVRSSRTLVVTFTQQPAGSTATCTSALE